MAVITGTDATDTLEGTAGKDTIRALGGDDFVFGADANDVIFGGDGRNNLSGGVGNDRLVGGNAFDFLNGGKGNDTLDGGNDNTGNGIGFFYTSATNTGVNVNLKTGIARDGEGGTDRLINITEVNGTIYDDVLTGGNKAHDAYEFFAGGGGKDTIDGGSGYDAVGFFGDGDRGIIADLGKGTVRDEAGNIDRVFNVEELGGTRFSDLYTGDSKANVFVPSFGSDAMDGAGGSDTASYEDEFLFSLNAGLPVVNSGIDGDLQRGTIIDLGNRIDTISRIENITGCELDDALRGNAGVNVLTGVEGDDLLSGRGGNDVLDGGIGQDMLFGGTGSDRLIPGLGDDFLRGGAGADLFVFARLGDFDTVSDFRSGTDKIDVTAFNFANGAAVLNRAHQEGTSLVIELDADTAVELAHTALAEVKGSDFLV